MAYLKPPAFVLLIVNPLAVRIGLGGAVTLVVAGRVTGDEQTVPVIPVDQDGTRYVVSTRGESEWVRNVRRAGRVELRERGARTTFAALELPVAERPPVIAAYRAKAGRTVETYWKRLPDPADHPVFRLEAPTTD